MRRALVALGSIFVAAIAGASACHGHDSLAYTTGTTSSSSSGHGGASSSHASSSSSSGGAGGIGGAGGTEPSGPPKLTIVNGVPDYDAVRFCFLPYPAGDPKAVPWPAQASGLAFAHAVHVDPIASAIPSNVDVQAWVVGGDLASTQGKTCSEILAMANQDGGPSVVAVAMPVVPAATFTAMRSLLVVAMGCLGGQGHDGKTATLGCGMTYTPDTPTATLFLAPMSRASKAGAIGLQVAIANVAAPPADVTLAPGAMGAVEEVLAMDIAPGAIGAQVAGVGLAGIGVVGEAQVRTYQPQTQAVTSSMPLSQIAKNGNLDLAKVVDGSHLVLVSVGGYPGTPETSFWHGHTYALIDGDP